MLCSFLLLFITKEKRAVFLSPFVYCLKEKGTQQLMIIDDNCINYINNKQKNMLTKEKCAVFLSPFVYCLKEKGTQQLMIIDDNCINYINNKQKNKGTQNASPLFIINKQTNRTQCVLIE